MIYHPHVAEKLFGSLRADRFLLCRIVEAAHDVPIKNLAVSPQCGFASNCLNADDRRRKLERLLSVARRVWGSR